MLRTWQSLPVTKKLRYATKRDGLSLIIEGGGGISVRNISMRERNSPILEILPKPFQLQMRQKDSQF